MNITSETNDEYKTITFGLPDIMERTKLPFAFQPRQVVNVCFAAGMELRCCTIIKVHYTNKAISYDVEVACFHPKTGSEHLVRLYNIAAEFVYE